MFGILKDKLSKAIKSISEKFKEKEKKKEEVGKKVEEKIEEAVEEIVEKPKVEKVKEKIGKKAEEKIEEKIEQKIEKKIEEIVEAAKEPEMKMLEMTPEAKKPKIEMKKEIKREIEEAKKEIREELRDVVKEMEKAKEKPQKKSLIKKLFERVTKTIVEKRLSEDDLRPVLDELETDLTEADVAVEVAEKIKNDLITALTGKEIKRGGEKEAIINAFKKSLLEILSVPEVDLKKIAAEKKPVVLLFLGFNGSGKTTSLAKTAKWLMDNNLTCILAAADTFRAASLEQLEEHANKIGVKMIKHKYGADPAAVVYDAISSATAKGINFVLADTAGRTHINRDLMEELRKIIRVNKPDLKILVVDSMTGNDAILQARMFGDLGVDAVIFTKVDVNEKGGAILSVTNELKKPILFLGRGQRYEDFEKFDAEKFVSNLLT